MNVLTYSVNFDELRITLGDVAEMMGYRNEPVPSPIDSLINQSLADAGKYAEIKGGFSIVEDIQMDPRKKSVLAHREEFKVKFRIFNELNASEKIALFICTAGPEIGNMSRKFMRSGELLQGYIIDVIGSVVVERAMDKIQQELGNLMRQSGYKITNRYSPGYCGWQTEEQHKLFAFFPGNFCGVRLTDSALMDPVKSVSGIIGIGHDVVYHEYNCDVCDAVNCIYRKS